MMMEKISNMGEATPQHYSPHLKKVLKTYQKSAIKSLQGPSTVLTTVTGPTLDSSTDVSGGGSVKKETACESSPELPLDTVVASTVAAAVGSAGGGAQQQQQRELPLPQVPILSTADQSAELSETLVEGHRISCFIIGGEKRICFPQLLSTVLPHVPACTITNVSTELYINFSSCNSEQLLALKAKGLLPAETPTCGLVTKPDAERLCSVLLHKGGAMPDGLDKHNMQYSFYVYHECFSGAIGVLYYQLYTERNWCVQCDVCRRLFTPREFVSHCCYMDKKSTSIHTRIEAGICHWGFDSMNWRLYIHVLEDQPDYDRYTQIMETFKKQHHHSELIPLKRKQVIPSEPYENNVKTAKIALEESTTSSTNLVSTIAATTTAAPTVVATTVPKIERVDEDEDERWYMKKRAKVVSSSSSSSSSSSTSTTSAAAAVAAAAAAAEEAATVVTCASIPSYYGPFHSYYSNLCENWLRGTAVAGYHHASAPWPAYPPIPFTKDAKSYCFAESVPAFLAQDPPVLLNPERVVPLSQSEQFERGFQPNVALAPPPIRASSDGMTYSKLKRGVIRVKTDPNDIHETFTNVAPSYYDKDGKTDRTEVKPPPISPVITASLPPSTSPRSSPITEPISDNGVNSVVDQVAAVLDALSDAEDAVRQRVISLVERLTLKIDRCDAERQKFLDEIKSLRAENVQLYFDNTQLRQQLEDRVDEKELRCSSTEAICLNNGSVYPSPYPNRNAPAISSSKYPNCSPVSVITSPSPLTVIKSESAA